MTENTAIIKYIEGKGLPIVGNDIDTDQIIPARFLRSVTFEGLGEQVFRDERFHADGTEKKHSFNDKKYQGATILIANRNFGCGSSREHAPQAIMRFGIRAIIGESFAEIFAGNCTSLGIPVFTANEAVVRSLQEQVETNPETVFSLDIEKELLRVGEQNISLTINPSTKSALINGTWNTLDELLLNKERIGEVYTRLPYITDFA